MTNPPPPDTVGAMTEPAQDDLTADDTQVSQTDNGWRDGDGPQPAQTAAPLPEETEQ